MASSSIDFSVLHPTENNKQSKTHPKKSEAPNPMKVFYKGKDIDFVVFVQSEEIAQEYLKDSTIPLSEVVGKFKVFTSVQGRGAEGVFSEASKHDLENEFGTKHEDEAIKEILKHGSFKPSDNLNKKAWTSTNDTKYASNIHA